MLQIKELLKCEKSLMRFTTFFKGHIQQKKTIAEKEKLISELIVNCDNLNIDPLINEIYNNFTNDKLSKELLENYSLVKIAALLSLAKDSIKEIEYCCIDVSPKLNECVVQGALQIDMISSSVSLAIYELREYILPKIRVKSDDEILEDLAAKKNLTYLPPSIKEKFVYLKELGMLDVPKFKNSIPKLKENHLSRILGCHVDYARDLLKYNEHKYSSDKQNGIKKDTIDKVKLKLL